MNQVTKEAREQNAKLAKKEAEGAKTQLRNIRQEHNNAIKKSKELTEDERCVSAWTKTQRRVHARARVSLRVAFRLLRSLKKY